MQSITVLIASDCDLTARMLGSALDADGYVVDRVRSGCHALEAVRASAPNAVLVDAEMPDMRGIDLCRELRGAGDQVGATPVILFNTGGDRRADRLAAFGAGAWEVCPRPLDGPLLMLKLQTFIHAQRATARLGATSLMDVETDVYNLAGLLVRARELQALAARRGEPLACVVFEVQRTAATDPAGSGADVAAMAGASFAIDVVRFCRTRLRASDTLGRIAPNVFAVLAPETDGQGAAHLTLRLRGALDDIDDGWPAGIAPFRVACTVVADCAEADGSIIDALLQATRDVGVLRPGRSLPTSAGSPFVGSPLVGSPLALPAAGAGELTVS